MRPRPRPPLSLAPALTAPRDHRGRPGHRPRLAAPSAGERPPHAPPSVVVHSPTRGPNALTAPPPSPPLCPARAPAARTHLAAGPRAPAFGHHDPASSPVSPSVPWSRHSDRTGATPRLHPPWPLAAPASPALGAPATSSRLAGERSLGCARTRGPNPLAPPGPLPEEEVSSKKKVLKKEYDTAATTKPGLHKKVSAKRVPTSKPRKVPIGETMQFKIEQSDVDVAGDKKKKRARTRTAKVLGKSTMIFDVPQKFKVMSLIAETIRRTAADQKRSCGLQLSSSKRKQRRRKDRVPHMLFAECLEVRGLLQCPCLTPEQLLQHQQQQL
nr:vegetative cell wall protein gp1-like [Aegilops tauschii subsp. strangulata]